MTGMGANNRWKRQGGGLIQTAALKLHFFPTGKLPAADDGEDCDFIVVFDFPVQFIGESRVLIEVYFQKAVRFSLRVDTFFFKSRVPSINVSDYFPNGAAAGRQGLLPVDDIAEIRG
jgi:hypothetical protein